MSFALTILGSSSALPTSVRNLTAHVLNVDERFFLIDCGEGTQLQIRKYKARLGKINHIFISHLHGDHVFGLPGLLSTFNLLGRDSDLHIYAHSRIKSILNPFLSHFVPNFNYRIIYHDLKNDGLNLIFEDSKLTIHSFPLKHRIETCGFIFREKPKPRKIIKDFIDFYHIPIKALPGIKNGDDFICEDGTVVPNEKLTHPGSETHSYAFCSDTAYLENIIPYIKDVQLLYHEATFSEEDRARALETFHSTASDAAKIAKMANAQKLIIGHFSARYKDHSVLEEEARIIFPETYAAEDGLEIKL
jgi:ribonuclease Z